MKNYTRRKFIRTSFLTTSLCLFSPRLFSGILLSNEFNKKKAINYIEAKELFFRKKYVLSQKYFHFLMEEQPDNILIYNGMAKTLCAQNNLFGAAEIYRSGWLLDTSNPRFSDLLARTMQSLFLGHLPQKRKFSKKIGNIDLLQSAIDIYANAIFFCEKKIPLRLVYGVMDLQKTIAKLKVKETESYQKQVLDLLDKTVNDKEIKVIQEKRNNGIVFPLNEKKADYYLEKALNKNRRFLYFDTEIQSRRRELRKWRKRLYYPIFLEALKGCNIIEVERLFFKIRKLHANDSNILNQMIHFYRKHKEYKKLIELQYERYQDSPTFWNAVTYAQSLRLSAEKESKRSFFKKSFFVYEKLKNTSTKFSLLQYSVMYAGQQKCLMGLGEYRKLRENVLTGLSKFPLSYAPFVLTYINSLVAEEFFEQGEQAYLTLLGGLENHLIKKDAIYPHLQTLNMVRQSSEKTMEKNPFLLDVYYALTKLYEKTGHFIKRKKMLNIICEVDPENAFLKKRNL